MVTSKLSTKLALSLYFKKAKDENVLLFSIDQILWDNNLYELDKFKKVLSAVVIAI